jgi:hypothetical protein
MVIEIPPGTEIKPDGTITIPATGKIVLPGGTIDIPAGTEIKSDGTVIIPVGTTATASTSDGTTIALPGNTVLDPDGTIIVGDDGKAGATITYSNGKTKNVRPGATITIKPDGALSIAGNGGSGGCDAGYVYLTLSILGFAPFVLRKRE